MPVKLEIWYNNVHAKKNGYKTKRKSNAYYFT